MTATLTIRARAFDRFEGVIPERRGAFRVRMRHACARNHALTTPAEPTLSEGGQLLAAARSQAFGIVLPEQGGQRGPLVTEERTWAVVCNLSIS
jgi:hypothetical protein